MKRNSAYYTGVILSILGEDSTATFNDCGFSNNNGILGGIMYVTSKSIVNINNSTLFNNFAISAGIGYVANQGVLVIKNCDISQNTALTTGLIESISSTAQNTISNCTIYKNELTTKESLLQEMNDDTICIDLCFASDGFMEYLIANATVLDSIVSYFPLYLD